MVENPSFILSRLHPNYSTSQQWTGIIVVSLAENLNHQTGFVFTLKSAKVTLTF